MTNICVAGGTGQVGREVVRQALADGHGVNVMSRHIPTPGSAGHVDGARYFGADVTTGLGLKEALKGADVVIDCLEGRFGKALKTYADGGARLLRAAERAGVGRAVNLSIINCDLNGLRFYQLKAEKDRVYGASNLETVSVRATQFHSLLCNMFDASAKIRLLPVFPGARFQPISASDAACAVLEAAVARQSGDMHRIWTIGGPEVLTMQEFAEAWRSATGARALTVRVPLPGPMGKYLRQGLNLIPENRFGRETFEAYLAKRRITL